MATVYDRIFADVRKDIPSVIDAVLKQEMFRVIDDFCQKTNIWRQSIPVEILPNIKTYSVNANPGKTSRLMFVYDAAVEEPRSWAAGGIYMRVPGVMELYHKPTQPASWVAVVAVRPTDPVDVETKYPVAEDWWVDKYADTLGRGILARLQLEPQKPYSNPMLAAVNQRAYISGRSEARVNDEHANVHNGQNWRFPQGWATVQKKGFA